MANVGIESKDRVFPIMVTYVLFSRSLYDPNVTPVAFLCSIFFSI